MTFWKGDLKTGSFVKKCDVPRELMDIARRFLIVFGGEEMPNKFKDIDAAFSELLSKEEISPELHRRWHLRLMFEQYAALDSLAFDIKRCVNMLEAQTKGGKSK